MYSGVFCWWIELLDKVQFIETLVVSPVTHWNGRSGLRDRVHEAEFGWMERRDVGSDWKYHERRNYENIKILSLYVGICDLK